MLQVADVQKMSIAERLAAMELLWESLSQDEDLPSPKWHEDVLTARREKIASGTAEVLSLEGLKEHLGLSE